MAPVNLNSYVSWANTQSSRLSRVVLSDAGNTASTVLRQASTRLTAGMRMFHTSSSRRLAREVNTDFRNALEARFRGCADQALDTVMGVRWVNGQVVGRSKLTAGRIKKAVAVAEQLHRAAMARPGAAAPRLTAPALPQGFASARLLPQNPANAQLLRNFEKMYAGAEEIMTSYPLTDSGIRDLSDRALRLTRSLQRLPVDILSAFNAPQDIFDLQTEVGDVRNQLLAHVQMLRTQSAGAALTYDSLRHSRQLWVASAKNCCLALARNPGLPPTTCLALQTLANGNFFVALEAQERGVSHPPARRALPSGLQALVKEFDPHFASVQLSDRCPDPETYVGDLQGKLEKIIRRAVSLTTGDRSGDRLPVRDTLMHELQNTLNRQPWATISKTFDASVGHQTVSLTSNLIPAKQLGPAMAAVYSNINGAMSHSYDETRAVNLNVSELRIADGTGQTVCAFSGVRHGVHCALAIPNAQTRAAANFNRAKNTALAALMSRPDLIQTALNAPGHVVDLPMTSLSLLTPDAFRRGETGEKGMLLEQLAAWDELNALGNTGGMTVAVPDPANPQRSVNVTVRPKVVAFNFGVNEGAISLGPLRPLTGGWHTSDRINRTAMEQMQGRVTTFLAGCRDPQKAETVRALWTQINSVTDRKAQHHDRGDAYKAVARLAVMTWVMGDVPCWNCKSGKDRTGEMDVECKFLATLIARGQKLPDPGAALTDEQRALFTSLALEGGNHELQAYNTTLAGFKTGHVRSIAHRLGTPEARALYRGAAKFVKV